MTPQHHTYGLEVEPTKTEAGDRVLPIPEWLRNDLAAMLVARADERGVVSVGPDEPLFESIKGGKPIRVADLRRWVIVPALKAAGLPVNLRTYDVATTHDDDTRPASSDGRLGQRRPGRLPAEAHPLRRLVRPTTPRATDRGR